MNINMSGLELPGSVQHLSLEVPEYVSKTNIYLFAIVALTSIYLLQNFLSTWGEFKAPFVGFRSAWEPRWMVGLRFSTGALSQVNEGYEKFKHGMFKIARNDADILVIPNKYVEELRALPDAKISAIRAHIKNLLGKYSTTNILLESDLHTRMLQTKLTPNLGSFVSVIESELQLALDLEVPKDLDEFKVVSVYDIVLRIVARISARVFIGEPACRNEEWLSTSIHYTENVFTTVMILRRLPKFTHTFVAPFLPSYWRLHANLNTAKKFIGPIVLQRRKEQASRKDDPSYEKPNDMLQWMMDAANENDGQPHKLAHRQLLLSLASIHTTTMSTAHSLYDLCAHPEYFDELLQEAYDVVKEDGGWKKTTLNKMRKLDSFLKESQRVNPPSLLAFNRIVQTPLTLSDGTHLPKGTHFSVPAAAILKDNENLPDADTFDGLRYYKIRQNPEEANRHQFAMTDTSNLHFGHGKYSCPGRFFASNEIKIILAHLLMDYEFKYLPGCSRPKNLTADENLYPDPSARLLMRKRANHTAPAAPKSTA
ncbi:P450 monooxygenase No.2 [Arthroderma uncinatum]|uniref:P450 monooxygenase No.2 n=1 Tax=Arthroderma uncinatum TaxID=74035 RepID=UPI00144AA004|nr:P450 monooxygenase No.2 [Arthroderma uncinatum]KAF3480659.1 P450 monooxygenase No.2 [Arthroderma uncinatum]